MSLKDILCMIPIIRDYRNFRRVYFESSSFLLFLKWRYFANKRDIYWPVSKQSNVRGNIIIGKGSRVGHRFGCYIQGNGKLFIGDYVGVAPNCAIISGNHGILNHSALDRRETIIGDYCWIATNSCILAGVVLGPRTIVGAGSVVTKSFPEGYCVIAGNPAKIVKTFAKEDVVMPKESDVSYYGYIRSDKFPKYYRKYLSSLKFDFDLSQVTANRIFINK